MRGGNARQYTTLLQLQHTFSFVINWRLQQWGLKESILEIGFTLFYYFFICYNIYDVNGMQTTRLTPVSQFTRSYMLRTWFSESCLYYTLEQLSSTYRARVTTGFRGGIWWVTKIYLVCPKINLNVNNLDILFQPFKFNPFCTLSKLMGPWLWVPWSVISSVRLVPNLTKVVSYCSKAVSYTHLDVYKRQGSGKLWDRR